MKSYTTARFWKRYDRLEASVKQRAREAYKLFEQNPYHPSLHFKKAHTIDPVYSVRVSLDYRVLGMQDGDDIVWFWIGPHDEYDDLISRL